MASKICFDENMLLELKEMLYSTKYSKKEICQYFNVSEDVIDRLRRENNFVYNRKEKQYDEYIFTEKQLEVLQGCLLGDGCLNINKGGKNATFSYTSKSKEMVEYVYQYFKDLVSSEGVKYSERYDKRTNKIYIQYSTRTNVHPAFTEVYNKWYIDGVKHIPKDLILTPTVCLLWYLGDGSLIKVKNRHSMHINFATHCFEKKEIESVLISQLYQYNAKIIKSGLSKDYRQQYSIEIPGRAVYSFLYHIGSCPVKYYSYKWDVIEYERPISKSCKEYEDIFISLYKEGMTCYKIAKMFNVSVNGVKRYIKKAGIYEPVKRENLIEPKILKYLDLGYTEKEIIEKLNISRYLFYYYRKKWKNEKR